MAIYSSAEEIMKKYFKKSAYEIIEDENFDEQEKIILENFDCAVKNVINNPVLVDSAERNVQ